MPPIDSFDSLIEICSDWWCSDGYSVVIFRSNGSGVEELHNRNCQGNKKQTNKPLIVRRILLFCSFLLDLE